MNYDNWRDCDAWRKQNLPMNTSSNEAAKLFDISLSQLIGYHDNKNYNGLESSLNSMIAADPDFVLGHCLKTGIELLGSNALLNSYQNNIDLIKQKSILLQPYLTKREINHVKAIDLLHQGELIDAVNIWENILIDNPTDVLALKFAHSSYFYLGNSKQMRDSVARVLPYWTKSTPYNNYLNGMYAFGLAECGEIDRAQKMAMIGLDLCKSDAWAAHAICHCNEYSGQFENGVNFLLKTENDWKNQNFIAEHNYWHLALFYLELNKQEEVIQVFENNLMKTNSNLDMINSSSLLLRLKMDNEAIYNSNNYLNNKWNKLKDTLSSRIEEHGYLFTDFHIGLVLSACGTEDEKKKYFDSFYAYLDSNIVKESNYLKNLNSKLGSRLLKSLFYFHEENYSKVVELLYPIRYEIWKIGGSKAQKDILTQILIHSACRSNIKLGMALLNERIADYGNKSDLILRNNYDKI